MKPYRTLVFAEMVQESPLSTGGNSPHRLVDLPLSCDGRGRPVLRGTSLAGSFIASARRIFGKLPKAITDSFSGSGRSEALTPSAWRFTHAHPLTTGRESVFLQHVSIDPRTQAAKDDHLFSLEALPAGTRWNFDLEISPAEDQAFSEIEAMAAATLAEWCRPGGVRIGRGNNHGYGWCHLENLRIVRLGSAQASLWPDAFAPQRSPQEWGEYFREKDVPVLDLEALLAGFGQEARTARQEQCLLDLSGTLQVGERDDTFGQGYGLDSLSIGGHARLKSQAQDLFEHILTPLNIPFVTEENFDPDFTITALRDSEGKLAPYVPGASIRGVWRGMLSRHCQAMGHHSEILDALFGSTERAGQMSVGDATLVDEDWKLLWQQHVAIDEFSGGAYGAAKFDRLSIARARFQWQARIVGASQEEVERLAAPLIEMLGALGDGQLPLGGGVWRGHGHVRWQCHPSQIRTFGSPGGTQ